MKEVGSVRHALIVFLAAGLLWFSCNSQPSDDIELAGDGFGKAEGEYFFSTSRTQGDSGEEYVFTGTGLVFPKNSHFFGDAMIKGMGQFLLREKGEALLLSGGEVISREERQLVLKVGGRQIKFAIDKGTRICDGKRSLALRSIVQGDIVVVTAKPASAMTAISIRKGPMLLKTGGSFGSGKSSFPVNFRCR